MQNLQHITVSHFGTDKLHTTLLERHLNGQVGHQSADSTGHRFVAGQAVRHHQIQELITVEQTPARIHKLQAIGITIQSNAVIGPMLLDRHDQGLRMGGAHTFVDVETIG